MSFPGTGVPSHEIIRVDIVYDRISDQAGQHVIMFVKEGGIAGASDIVGTGGQVEPEIIEFNVRPVIVEIRFLFADAKIAGDRDLIRDTDAVVFTIAEYVVDISS